MSKQAGQNYLWASLIIEELVRNGVDYFCIAPGSRSTPLTVAAAKNKKAKTFVHFDERGLAFHALGYLSAQKGGVAVITTSGSAVANLFPAVMEASKKKLPLILLTADRPPELRATGANQTVDQVSIFGKYVRFEVDLPVPTADIPPEFVLTTVDSMVFQSKGELPGPVHMNCMFREPFLPKSLSPVKGPARWEKTGEPFTKYVKSLSIFSLPQAKELVERVQKISKGILVVGKLRSKEEQKQVLKLSEKLQWPVLADITSGLRWGKPHPLVVTHFNQLLPDQMPQVDGVIQIGGRMTSKALYSWLKKQNLKEYIMALNHPLRHDPEHHVSCRIQASTEDWIKGVLKVLAQRKACWAKALLMANEKVVQKNEAYFQENTSLSEINAVYTLSKYLPKNQALFLANSLPIREMDCFAETKTKRDVPVSANRGASGIDGLIASAVGYSVGLNQPVTLLTGDLAFLYDLNSLAMLKNSKQPVTIIVFNNNGGGIFNFLPIAKEKNVFEEFFAAPQNITMKDAAKMFHLYYEQPESVNDFKQALERAGKSKTSTLIELVEQRTENVREHKTIQSLN